MMTVFGTVALCRTLSIKASVEWFVILVGSFRRPGSFSSSWCAIPISLLRGASNMLSKVLDRTLTFNQHTMGLHKYNWVDELLYNTSTSRSSTLFNRNQSVCFLSFSCLLCHLLEPFIQGPLKLPQLRPQLCLSTFILTDFLTLAVKTPWSHALPIPYPAPVLLHSGNRFAELSHPVLWQ